jgi:hypothetical protein
MTVDERTSLIAKRVVTRLAPEELIFFDAASEAFRRNGQKVRPGGDPLGFGLTEVVALVTPVALAVSAAVVDDLVGRTATAAVDRGRRGVKWLRGTLSPELPELPVRFEPHELERIRALARAKALALGLPEDQTELLVDALIGSLALPATDDRGEESP